MENFKDLPLEVRLSAYLDGQLDEADAREIETLLATDLEAQDIYESLKIGSDLGNQAFEDMLKQPVPLHLVRAIKDASAKPATPVRQAANGNAISFMRFVPQAIAACAVLLLAGGYTGYFIGQKNVADMPMEISETSAFQASAPTEETVKTRGFTFEAPKADAMSKSDVALMEIASLHKIYSVDKTHADEVPASQEGEIKSYLEAVTSVAFSVPDLSAEGFKLRGGKLVVAVGQPTGALFYENDAGNVVAVYFMKNADVKGALPAKDGFSVVGGQKDATSYFIAAQDESQARSFEDSVRAAL